MYRNFVFITLFTLFLLQSCMAEEQEEIFLNEACEPINPAVTRSGDSSLLWVTPVSQASNVSFVTYCSGAAQTEVSYHIYTPPSYPSASNQRFPVLYWLHGGGLGPGIDGIPFFSQYFDNAIRQGLIPPMLVVFPHSPVRPFNNQQVISMWVDSFDKKSPVETILIQEVIPHVDANYRTIADKSGRALDGFSMGGYGAARLGFKFHDMFAAISILGAGPMQERLEVTPRATPQMRDALLQTIYGNSQEHFFEVSPRNMAETNANFLKTNMHIRIAVGDRDETYQDNFEFHEHLETLGIPHAFISAPGIPHSGPQLLNYLGQSNFEFYSSVFKNAYP